VSSPCIHVYWMYLPYLGCKFGRLINNICHYCPFRQPPTNLRLSLKISSLGFDAKGMDAGTGHSGHWGPVTATLDWCEVRRSFPSSSKSYLSLFHGRQANYQFSHYVAEISNTFSNLFFVCISLYGASLSVKQSLPARYLVGFAVRPRLL
jgi:hypothetical protein